MHGGIFLLLIKGPMIRDSWIRNLNGTWILRFGYDWASWDPSPKVCIEKGRFDSNGTIKKK